MSPDTHSATEWRPTHRDKRDGSLVRVTKVDDSRVHFDVGLVPWPLFKPPTLHLAPELFHEHYEPIPEAPAPARLAEIREAVEGKVREYRPSDINAAKVVANHILDTLRRMGVQLPKE